MTADDIFKFMFLIEIMAFWLKFHWSVLLMVQLRKKSVLVRIIIWRLFGTKPVSELMMVMMTSSNGNIFRVTGPLCGEFTGPGEFPTQRPVTRSFDVFFYLRLNKRLSKQPWGWWFETLSWSLWRQCNGVVCWRIYPSLDPDEIRVMICLPIIFPEYSYNFSCSSIKTLLMKIHGCRDKPKIFTKSVWKKVIERIAQALFCCV